MVPEPLGPFVLEALLGEGGSSFVFEARRGHEVVALKVLRPELGLDAREVERFVAEAHRMRTLRHRGLVPVLDAGVLPDGRPYIAMPRLAGRTLAAHVAAGGRMAAAHALALFDDVAQAVCTLHRAGLIHRDIKPENVIWLESEQRLVLLDLGIAREVDAAPSTTTLSGLARGTPAYMAPERFFGRPASVLTDVYELALLLYVMVVGRVPWDHQDPKGRITPAHPAQLGVLVPSALASVLLEALSVDPERRPTSVEALVGKLHEAWASSGNPASTDPSFGTAPTQVHRPLPLQAPQLTRPSEVPRGGFGSDVGTTAPSPQHVIAGSVAPPGAKGHQTALVLAIGGGLALLGAVVGGGVVLSMQGEAREARGRSQDDADEDAQRKVAIEQTDDGLPSASTEARVVPVASATVAAARPSATASVRPTATSTATTSSSAAAGGGTPPACSAFVALMCSPTSGARPEECTTWKSTVAGWTSRYPAKQSSEMCASALSSSQAGLAHRRAAGPPPTTP